MVRAIISCIIAAAALAAAHVPDERRVPTRVVARADPTITTMPLARITADKLLPPFSTLPATAAGSKPSGMPNAPALPDLSKFSAANYPTGDIPPDTNSPEVAQWVKDVKASGVVIPDFALRAVDGSADCQKAENVPRIGNETECWWTCGKCVRKTDIVDCKAQGNWGSSFDDGPSDYTNELLLYLEQQKLKTTFFVVGSRVALRPQTVQTQYMLGHQIGIHTWSHRALTTLSTVQVIAELGWSKKIVTDVIGVTPLYFRPPDGDMDDRIRAIARAMNLTPVIWTSVKDSNNQDFPFDSFDYLVAQGDVTATDSVAKFGGLVQAVKNYSRGSIVLEHDIVWQEVKLAVGYYLPAAQKNGFKVMSINQCMGQTLADTYAETTSLKGVPEGSGLGNDITGAGQKASSDAPLSGSNTSGDTTKSSDKPGSTQSGTPQGAAPGLKLSMEVLCALVTLSAALASW